MQFNDIGRRALVMGGLLTSLAWSVNSLAAAPARTFELGVEVGSAEQEYSLDEPIGDKSGDETAFRMYGTWFPQGSTNPTNLGVRAGYSNFGAAEVYKFDVGVAEYTVESDVSAFTLGGVLAAPIGKSPLEIWGEAGVAFWDLDLDQKASVPSLGVGITDEVDSDSGTSLYAGIGAGLQLGRGFGVSLSALWFNMEPEYGDQDVDLDIRVVSAGASLRF